jgi:hypothetical protein
LLFATSLQPIILDGSITQGEVKEILDLFSTRDNAVKNNSVEDFLRTQLDAQEIKRGSSRSYISCSKMTTTVLQIGLAEDKEIDQDMCAPYISSEDSYTDYAVRVREDYEHSGKSTHSAYITYFLSKADMGFRIVELRNQENKQPT